MLPVLASTPAMTTADLGLVMAIEAAAYSHPWTRGNFVDSLAAGYLARLACDAQGRCMGYFVAMLGAGEMHLLNLTVAPPLEELRRAYYPVQTGPHEDAVVMSIPLEGVHSAVD